MYIIILVLVVLNRMSICCSVRNGRENLNRVVCQNKMSICCCVRNGVEEKI